MKRTIIKIFLVALAIFNTQCYTEVIQEITQIPYDTIEEKKRELRDLQKQLNDELVKAVDLRAQINALINEINNLIPPPPPGAKPLSYSIGLVSAARETEQIGVSGAVVSMNIDGARVTATSDSDGQVLFENLRSGVVLVHVDVPGYTNVSFVADLMGSSDNVTSTIALYPTTAANGAVVLDGFLYYDPDRTDDLLPADPNYGIVDYNTTSGLAQDYRPAPVRNLTDGAFINETQGFVDARVQSWQFINQAINIFAFVQPNAVDYQYIPPANPGNIILAIYEEMFVTATSDPTDGSFQLVLPTRASASGGATNSFRIHLAEFEGTETYVRSINSITTPPSTVTTNRDRTVIYSAMYGNINLNTSGNVYFPGFPSGPSYTFSQTLVNNFTGTISTRGVNSNVDANFYFGARFRDP